MSVASSSKEVPVAALLGRFGNTFGAGQSNLFAGQLELPFWLGADAERSRHAGNRFFEVRTGEHCLPPIIVTYPIERGGPNRECT